MADFEHDLGTALGARMAGDEEFCKQVWSSLANVDWYNTKDHTTYSCSWRYAGGLIADILGEGNYMDWYCCGPDAVVSDEIARAMKKLGWIADTLGSICDEPGCIEIAGCGTPSDDGYRSTCFEHKPK